MELDKLIEEGTTVAISLRLIEGGRAFEDN